MTKSEKRQIARERKEILAGPFEKAREEAVTTAELFVGFCRERDVTAADIADAAQELYTKVGLLAGYATMLARTEKLTRAA